MRITLITAVYAPEPMVTARTSHDLATELARQGHTVTVLAPYPNRPAGRLYAGFRRRFRPTTQQADGVRILRCWSTFSPRSTMASRFLENCSFGFSSSLALLFQPRPDVVYMNSWPLFATGMALGVARGRGIPVVLSIQDVYPDSLAIQNRLRATSPIYRLLRAWDGSLARHAARVVVAAESFLDLYRERGVQPIRLSHLPNWQPDDAGRQTIDRHAARKALGLPDGGRWLVYGGNLGIASGIDIAAEAVSTAPAWGPMKLLVAGEGALLEACRYAADHSVDQGRVTIHSPWPPEQTTTLLGAADILFLPTQGNQSRVSIPSKLIAYMLSGRPVLACVHRDSDTARIIQAAGCGWIVAPDAPTELLETLRRLTDTPQDELDARGARGRDYALRHMTRQACLPTLIRLVTGVAHA